MFTYTVLIEWLCPRRPLAAVLLLPRRLLQRLWRQTRLSPGWRQLPQTHQRRWVWQRKLMDTDTCDQWWRTQRQPLVKSFGRSIVFCTHWRPQTSCSCFFSPSLCRTDLHWMPEVHGLWLHDSGRQILRPRLWILLLPVQTLQRPRKKCLSEI